MILTLTALACSSGPSIDMRTQTAEVQKQLSSFSEKVAQCMGARRGAWKGRGSVANKGELIVVARH